MQTRTRVKTTPSQVGALIVLESILGRAIDLDSIPLQAVAKGVTPGGTVDLAAAGVHPDLIRAADERAHNNNGGAISAAAGDPRERPFDQMRDCDLAGQQDDDDDEAMLLERERALAELMGGAPLRQLVVDEGDKTTRLSGSSTTAAAAEEGDEGREIYSLKRSGGFL